MYFIKKRTLFTHYFLPLLLLNSCAYVTQASTEKVVSMAFTKGNQLAYATSNNTIVLYDLENKQKYKKKKGKRMVAKRFYLLDSDLLAVCYQEYSLGVD